MKNIARAIYGFTAFFTITTFKRVAMFVGSIGVINHINTIIEDYL